MREPLLSAVQTKLKKSPPNSKCTWYRRTNNCLDFDQLLMFVSFFQVGPLAVTLHWSTASRELGNNRIFNQLPDTMYFAKLTLPYTNAISNVCSFCLITVEDLDIAAREKSIVETETCNWILMMSRRKRQPVSTRGTTTAMKHRMSDQMPKIDGIVVICHAAR